MMSCEPCEERSRRLGVLLISDALLLRWFREGISASRIVEGALSKDAKIIGVQFDGRTLRIMIEASNFEPVADGSPVPEIMIKFASAE